MMKADLVIYNGYVSTEQGMVVGGLAIKNGIIIQVGGDASLPEAEKYYDAKGNIIFPGAIEPHCHFELWVVNKHGKFNLETYIEEVRSETRTAVQGGYTTISSTTMQNAEPMKKRFQEFKEGMEGNIFCDVKFHISPFTEEHLEEIKELSKKGVTNYKFLMGYRGAGAKALGMDERGINTSFIYKGFKKIAEAGLPATAMCHCEDPDIFEITEEAVKAEDEPEDYNYTAVQNKARPAIAEVIDICKTAYIAHETGCPLYIVHVSAKESVDQIKFFKEQHFDITAETCPHYLVFAEEDAICRNNKEWTHYAKVNPAIRGTRDRERLWKGIQEGTIDVIGNDHTNYRKTEKLSNNYWDTPAGTGDGMSASFSIMLSEGVNKNRISLDTLRKIMSENVAKAMGLYPKKGTLNIGSDADIVILDLNKEWVFKKEYSESSNAYSLYDGMKLKGAPVATFVRGKLVAENFKIVANEASGVFAENPFPGKYSQN
ncbi:amidohydrolase family protein [Mediterraneibacter sp. NSJ-55]|uniref:Amidohydrolase family protein n=1 Tax=Mediterraneibacter hominis TaxID=2763054 RepID=A0A923LJW2_9FIRM|nr:amidohydrolase family protein [Mediterraneibacter hominis]MBC5689304.1 amidohydrolase family protein [Mediterraneibacter hominis]